MLVVLGLAAAISAHQYVAVYEHNSAEEAFFSEWEPRLTEMACTISMRVAATKSIGGAIAALGRVPTAKQFSQARPRPVSTLALNSRTPLSHFPHWHHRVVIRPIIRRILYSPLLKSSRISS